MCKEVRLETNVCSNYCGELSVLKTARTWMQVPRRCNSKRKMARFPPIYLLSLYTALIPVDPDRYSIQYYITKPTIIMRIYLSFYFTSSVQNNSRDCLSHSEVRNGMIQKITSDKQQFQIKTRLQPRNKITFLIIPITAVFMEKKKKKQNRVV